MNKIFLFIASFFVSALVFGQQRGDLISSELIADWSPDEQKSYVSETLGLDDPDVKAPIDPNLAKALLTLIANVTHPYDVKIYKIRYYSENWDGDLVETTGAISVPQNNHGKTMIILGHGHIYNRDDVFSNLNGAGGGALFSMVYSAQDYITVVPDYLGNADGEGREKTFNHIEGGNSMVDMYRAALTFTDNLGDIRNNQVFVGGYSQGGGNAMATIKYIQENNLLRELPVEYAFFGGGPYDFSETTFNYSVDLDYHNDPEYYFLYLRGAKDAGYDVYDDPFDVITPPYHAAWQYYEDNDAINKEDLSNNPKEMFTPEFFTFMKAPNSPVRQYARKLDNYNWRNNLPTVMTYSTGDTEVPYQNAIIARDAQRNKIPWYLWWKKAEIQAWNLGKVGHVECGAYTLLSSLPAFDARRTAWNIANPWYFFKLPTKALPDDQSTVVSSPQSLKPYIDLAKNEDKSIIVKNLSGNSVANSSARSNKVDLSALEPGIYLIETKIGDKVHTSVYNKPVIDPIRMDGDYFPISKQNGKFELDLSLLEEDAIKVSIYDTDRKLIHSYDNIIGDQLELDHMVKGDNIVEVSTKTSTYHLIATKDQNDIVEANEVAIRQLSANSIALRASSPISSVQLFDVNGKLLTERKTNVASERYEEVFSQIPATGLILAKVSLTSGQTLTKKFMLAK